MDGESNSIMKTFHAVLANSLIAFVANNFVWFAVTFWVYLQTKSVIATSVMAGVFTLTIAFSGFFLGSLVDRYPKKRVMQLSSILSLVLYAIAGFIFFTTPYEEFTDASSVRLWIFIVLALVGAIGGNLRGIALSTLVTILVPEDGRDKANGLVGTMNGVAFLGASIFSGLAVGYLGMFWVLVIAIVVSLLVIAHLATLTIPDLPKKIRHAHDGEPEHEHDHDHEGVDVRGTIRAIRLVPGLFGLIFFHTFNNFLGGIFMSLMDAYGLLLVSVQVWGILWGILSLGFIVGGMLVARYGLGKSPLRTLFLGNIVMWSICSVFTLQASIVLLAIGMFIWLCLIPAVEAAEQTILQKVVPPERQGRVFGFAQSVEQAASPVTAFLIGPIAQLIFIPFMTTGAGVDLIGRWFGTGTDRGLALLFTAAGVIGLVITLLAMRSNAYRSLSRIYKDNDDEQEMPGAYPDPA
jgi:DHA3 family multidrug efflux protein-like MFS transporter